MCAFLPYRNLREIRQTPTITGQVEAESEKGLRCKPSPAVNASLGSHFKGLNELSKPLAHKYKECGQVFYCIQSVLLLLKKGVFQAKAGMFPRRGT